LPYYLISEQWLSQKFQQNGFCVKKFQDALRHKQCLKIITTKTSKAEFISAVKLVYDKSNFTEKLL